MPFRSGFVCILGKPNAGKSTLLNALAGEKLAIVSPKPQTTRNRVLGVIHIPKTRGKSGAQVVLIDTPGVHRPDTSLGKKMMAEVREALNSCDLVMLIVDAVRKEEASDQFLFSLLQKSNTPVFLLLNKIDLLRGDKRKLLPLIEQYAKLYGFREVIPISARKREGMDVLLEKTVAALPEGPPYFPEDQVTDQPERFLAAEIVREKAIRALHHELPYAVAVFVDKFEDNPRLVRIEATLNVERDTQKKILIGHKGAMLKKIGTEARTELETLFDKKVFLGLFVKVAQDWRENPQRVRELDWHFQLEGLSEAQSYETEETSEETAEANEETAE